MTDERDPNQIGNPVDDNENESAKHLLERPRTMSGRFPTVTPGRGGVPQGRFSQSAMPAVPRAASAAVANPGASSLPPVNSPRSSSTQQAVGRPVNIVGARGGRPGMMGIRSARPAVHAMASSAQDGDRNSESGFPGSLVPDVDDAINAMDDLFGGPAPQAESRENVADAVADAGFADSDFSLNSSDGQARIDMDDFDPFAAVEADTSHADGGIDIGLEIAAELGGESGFSGLSAPFLSDEHIDNPEDMVKSEDIHVDIDNDLNIEDVNLSLDGDEGAAPEVASADENNAVEIPADENNVSEVSADENNAVEIPAAENIVSAVSAVENNAVEISANENNVSEISAVENSAVEVSADESVAAESASADNSELLFTEPPAEADHFDVAPEPEESYETSEAVAGDASAENVEDDADDVEETGAAPAEKGPAFTILPIPAHLKQEASLRDNNAYRRESRSLIRAQNWTDLVQMMQNVLQYATWADMQEVRSSILKELAGIYQEKLDDAAKARETYEQLMREDPSNESAIEYMEGIFRAAADYKSMHAMYRRVVDATWESDARIEYTRRAAELAQKELAKPDLAVADWEHLWEIGEQSDEVQNALMTAYREHGSWEKLASFIREKCVDWGTIQQLGLREVIEIYISGLGDAERASETLNVLLKDRPKDPLLLLQDINICRLNGDIDKLARISRVEGLDKTVEQDIHRAAAEVLWNKGERDLALDAYNAILEESPDDRDALHIKELYFEQGGYNDQLCDFYVERAERALELNKRDDAVALYRKAADVAEKQLFDNPRAIILLKKVIELDPSDMDIHRKVIELYESVDDNAGVAASMEALLALTSRPAVRRELLAKLGGFYLDKLENFDKAEDCWKKVQAIDPRNPSVSEELSRVYAKKGDFESLDKSLTEQIRMADDSTILQLAKSKGKYLMQHNPESAHTAAGWEIVLDCDPDDQDALENLGEVLDKLERQSERIGVMEQALRNTTDSAERITLGLRIADTCVESATHVQAVAAYLRVLNWDPMQESAIRALETICSDAERGIVIAVLEVAATIAEDKAERSKILKQTLRFVPKDNAVQRIQILRRVLALGDESVSDEFVSLCREEKHSDILCAEWLRRASATDDENTRSQLLSDVARFSAEDLNNPSLAFTILFASALDSEKAVVLARELEKLAPDTNRWEEVVAVLGCLSSNGFDEETRRNAIEKRIDILTEKLQSPARAIEEYARLLEMNPDDELILAKVEHIADENALFEPLLGIYGEVWDNTQNKSLRAEISQRRYLILKRSLSRDFDALNELFIGYRLNPNKNIEDLLVEASKNPEYAALCVPLLESEKRAGESPDDADLRAVAGIYETSLSNVDGAFELYSAVLTHTPTDSVSFDKLSGWATAENHSGRYAQVLRIAASHAHKHGDDETSLRLYRRLASFYRDSLNDLERSVDVERTILHIDPNCIESLEAIIAWHTSHENWAELRSELIRRISVGGSDADRIALWQRVVDISNDHLNDLEGAFDGYAEILQIDDQNEHARNGLAALTGADIGPEVELRRLRLELKLAETEKRPEILLKIATLQDKELSLPDASCETLEQLYRETGPTGEGYMHLVGMCERLKLWNRQIQIMLEHADALIDEDPDEAIATYNEALEIADKKLKDIHISAQIVEKLQQLDPENEEIVARYCASLRNTENWSKYAETVKSLAGDPNSKNVKKSLLFEYARVQALALNNLPEAIKTYQSINRRGPVERNAYFGVASMALKMGDIDQYLGALDMVLRLLDPAWGAIFYCHMAEVCDEKEKHAQVATYYRNARALDPNNVEASDSLRSIGRRLKNWRSTSALLPDENEKSMTWAERSNKLLERCRNATDLTDARIWAWKAIAVNHDNIEAWQALASVEERAGRLTERYEACLGAMGAVERMTLPGPSHALNSAKMLHETAIAAQACGNNVRADALIHKAFTVAPEYAPVAIAIGDLEQDSGNIDKAYEIYDHLLKSPNASLDEKLRGEVLLKRGLIANIQQNYALALDDLRTTVQMMPLHYDALMAIARTYAEMKQPLLALSCLQKSLLVTPEHTKRRGNIYYDMGKLWGDAFKDTPEAGLYYEAALNNGASNVDLVERCLEIYKISGRYHEALTLVDTLTKTTTNPAILASLYCTRGELSESISPEEATEAYDMALSYAPGLGRAFDGLERMLVAREEWEQLADLLNGRLESDLSPAQESAILLRLADLYGKQLDEPQKSADILYRLLDSAPSADVIERLLVMPSDNPDNRRRLLEKAILFCPGCFNYALELAQNHLQSGRELQAWAIMSPLRALLQLDAQTKDTVNDLKTKFEKADSISPDTLSRALPILSDEQFSLLDAIRVVSEKIGSLGPKQLDEITSGATEVTEFTPNGKIFHQLRAGLGLENIVLYRSAELPEAIMVVDAEPTIVCVRTEIFQKAAGNELQFWLAKGIAMAHPDVRILASTPANMRNSLPMAVLAATGLVAETPETADIVARIKAHMNAAELSNLAAQLTSTCDKDALVKCAQTFTQDMLDSTDILGSYAIADMRTVWRAESRIDANIIEQRSVKTVDDINRAMESSNILRKVLAYYVSSSFTEHLAG